MPNSPEGVAGIARLLDRDENGSDFQENESSIIPTGTLKFRLVSEKDVPRVASRVASIGREIDKREYFVVSASPEHVLQEVNGKIQIVMSITRILNNVVERLSISGKRTLREEDMDEEIVKDNLRDGEYTCLTLEQVLEALEREREKTVIGITGGGDCAGIADCLSSFYRHLREYVMLGVKNAGKGLIVDPADFASQLVVLERLVADDLEGQSSTPLGSAREDALKKNPKNTLANIAGRRAFYGTGGNDHLGLLERIAREFPEMCVVGTFKSIDGDGWIDGKPAQMLGFNSAVRDYRKAIYDVATSAAAHEQITVVEVFGRNCGKLAFEAARRDSGNVKRSEKPRNVKVDERYRLEEKRRNEENRKIVDFGDTIMILVPEKPVSLAKISREAMKVKEKHGSCVTVVAEGFMPPELGAEMQRLGKQDGLRKKWQHGILKVEDISRLIQSDGKDDPRNDLKILVQDPELAAQFAKTIWSGKLDSFGNGSKLSGIRKFIIAAIEKLGGASKVNECLETYEARGTSPSEYDQVMGRKIGKMMAKIVRDGQVGGKAVVFLEGMDAMWDEPIVVDLKGVSDENNLGNVDLYPEKVLRDGGVFWDE